MDWKKFSLFLNHTSKLTSRSKFSLLTDAIASVFNYNISLLEYFQFRFFELTKEHRKTWAGTGYMFEYQLKMNPKSSRDILDDKTKFYRLYKEYFVHNVADLVDLKSKPELVQKILDTPSGKLVFKVADGNCGIDVQIEDAKKFDAKSIITFMENSQFDLVEEFIQQHSVLNALSPSGVNTVRIFTQLDDNNEVVLLGCRQRISVNSDVDNMAAGNMAATIDEITGIISGTGVYSDITKPDEKTHPITGVEIVGLQIPFWNETVAMVKKAAKAHPENRSIGWDIVITEKGPGFIEGNHDWCKLLWQLPTKQGLKSKLEPYLH
ncbi:sugar-transfer associated ATP-grasp domain-containing protein [Flavobacterium sp.]|uniref:sugar-transfer associated ATP-grasp domain-containing protein n=1 Tax=Flavobacterium sp. TaxID=239 RepID=UPI002488A794|nr:sugar-transfer associated ATP-grasp domain-containing protein [Flavobacterium sp.]MDI1318532.1 sugar-transfer associated ATP-grasp domain-containing protein [Flavobacterium sp.]